MNTPAAKIIVVTSTTLCPCFSQSSCCCGHFGRLISSASTKATTKRISSWHQLREQGGDQRQGQDHVEPELRAAPAAVRRRELAPGPRRFERDCPTPEAVCARSRPIRYAAKSTHAIPAGHRGQQRHEHSPLSASIAAIARAVGPPHGTMFITPAPRQTTPASTSGRMPSLR